MWSVEHGPSVDDEINLLVAGRNYGWDPLPGYNESVSMTDLMKFPGAVEAKWSSGSPTLATSGGIFLEGDQWGVWEGRLALATLQDSKLRLFEFTPEGAFVSQVVVPELNGAFGRLRTPMMGPRRRLVCDHLERRRRGPDTQDRQGRGRAGDAEVDAGGDR